MDSYRASKAWHLGQDLVREVHALIKGRPDDGSDLPGSMRKTSVAIPMHIASSVSRKSHQEKMDCYVEAREAAISLQKYLSHARAVQYIDKEVFEALAGKAIEAQNLLTVLIRKAAYDIAAAKE